MMQPSKADAGFQTARAALAKELRKNGRPLPLQPRDGGGQRRSGGNGVKESDYSSGCMFPEGQGAFTGAAAPRQGMLRSRGCGLKRSDAGQSLDLSAEASVTACLEFLFVNYATLDGLVTFGIAVGLQGTEA